MRDMERIDGGNAPNEPVVNILGEKIALGPRLKSMTPFFLKWENDFSVAILSGDPLRPITQERIESSYEASTSGKDAYAVDFVIYERATSRLIGTTGLRHVNMVMRTAEYGILIGEKDCWGKGYGTEATTLMLDYAFTVLGLHNVLLNTYGYNERAVRAYTRAGFRVMGRWREAARLGAQVYDVIFMDCLSTEFRNPFKRVVDLP